MYNNRSSKMKSTRDQKDINNVTYVEIYLQRFIYTPVQCLIYTNTFLHPLHVGWGKNPSIIFGRPNSHRNRHSQHFSSLATLSTALVYAKKIRRYEIFNQQGPSDKFAIKPCRNAFLGQRCQAWHEIGSDWPQMGQIMDFLRSNS